MQSQPAVVDMNRDQRVLQHQGLVRGIAASVWRMIGGSVSLEDLVGYGQVGLIEAIDRFRPEAGCQFSTFAYYRIRGAVLDGLCKMRGLSRRAVEKVRFSRGLTEVQAARAEEGEPSAQDVEKLWGSVQESLRDSVVLFMLSRTGETVTDEVEQTTEDQILAREWRELVSRALAQIPRAEADLVRSVYFKGMSLSDVAEKMGVSRSWATRLHRRAIGMMRACVERFLNPPPGSGVLR